ncbi:MAG: TIGR02466 family protein [Amphiplicatus sp.]
MTDITPLFVTRLQRALLPKGVAARLNEDIVAATLSFAEEDAAGIGWCREHSYPGYTSYGSLNDLPSRAPCFAELKKHLDAQAKTFAQALSFDLGGGRLKLDNLWVNLLEPRGFHAGHIHPHSVISGTYYAQTPKGAAALKLEDPRLPMMMAAPPRREDAPEADRNFVYVAPEPGMTVMWESWLRHEVPRNDAKKPRISVSFNYRWG